MRTNLKRLLLAASVFFIAVSLLCFPQTAADGAKNGIGYCMDILIPSLFPFMVLSVFVVKSGMAALLGKAMAPLCRVLFALPGSAAAAIVMSMLGGYPVGARAAASLVQDGDLTREEGARMLYFCVNAGPAFVISVVGASLLQRAAAGILILTSQLLACVVLGIYSSIGIPRKKMMPKKAPKRLPLSQAFIVSAADASRSMLAMCAFVVLFAAVLALLRLFVPAGAPAVLLSGVMEVTGGCCDAANFTAPLWYFALILGWGGLCVQFQVLSSTTELCPSIPRFFLFRLLHGILSSVFTLLLCRIFPEALPAFFNTTLPLQAGMGRSVPACTALVFLCILLLLQIKLPKESKDAYKSLDFAMPECYNKKAVCKILRNKFATESERNTHK